MKIKAIRLRNFQSHKATDLELHPGVNALVGKTHHGKTAVKRAIELVANNEPHDPSVFISRWAQQEKGVSVEIDTDNSRTVIRERSKTVNVYKLDKEKYTAFGQGVPEDIKNLLKIEPINIQSQFDGPYMFGEKDGNVAREFNAIAHLDCIDRAFSHLESERRRVRSDMARHKEKLKEESENLKRYYGLANAEKEISRLAELEKKADGMAAITERASIRIVELEDIHKQLQRYSNVEKSTKQIICLIEDCKAGDVEEKIVLHAEILVNHLCVISQKLAKYGMVEKGIKHVSAMAESANVIDIEEKTLIRAAHQLTEQIAIRQQIIGYAKMGKAIAKVSNMMEKANVISDSSILIDTSSRNVAQFDAISKKISLFANVKKALLSAELLSRQLQDSLTYEANTNALESMLKKYETAKRQCLDAQEKENILHKEFDEKFPDVCPLCGSMGNKGTRDETYTDC